MPVAPLPVRMGSEGLRIAIRLTPKAGRDEIGGVEMRGGESVLMARVRALPDQGQANDALLKLVAGWLGVPKSRVSLASGGKSRLKMVAVQGEPDALMRRIADLLGGRK